MGGTAMYSEPDGVSTLTWYVPCLGSVSSYAPVSGSTMPSPSVHPVGVPLEAATTQTPVAEPTAAVIVPTSFGAGKSVTVGTVAVGVSVLASPIGTCAETVTS